MGARTIPALEFRPLSPRTALTVAAGRFREDLYHGGTGSPLRLREVRAPERPEGWVRIAPTLSGICASDRKILHVTALGFAAQAVMGSGFHPWILGHEIVGRVLAAPAGSGLAEGDRVVAEPTLSCVHKDLPTCQRCARGDDHRCAHLADAGALAGGHGFGHHARYGGGWAAELVAPADRVHRVPDDLDDRSAVLAEPTAVGVHAILRTPPPPGGRVLVIGPGAIGLTLTTALTTLFPGVHVVVAGVDDTAADLAARAGAASHVTGTGRQLVEAIGADVGSVVRGDAVTGRVLEDGVDVVYDCVGSRQTLHDAAAVTRPGGSIVLLGTSARVPVDLTLFWLRELRLVGSGYYAVEDVPAGGRLAPGRRRAMQVALEVLDEHRPGHLVTHVFTLDESVDALATAAAGPAAGAVRVAFAPLG